ncbi:MAG: ABC transporter permease subunit [Acidimicrobiia bacterium]|nr:ABC transporter permease subunit [Acidimicrobiia bacterium]
MKGRTAILLYGGLTIVSLVWLLPMIGTLAISFRPLDEVRAGWWNLSDATITFDNYGRAWSEGLASFTVNSFVIALGATAATVLLGTMAAFAFARLQFRFKGILYFLLITTMIVPIQLIIIPMLPWFQTLGLNEGHLQFVGIILVHTAFGAGWAIFMMSGFFADIPNDIVEAAEIDGATTWQVFRKVGLPLALPGIVSFAIIDFIFVWNDLLLALTLLDRDHQPIQVGLANLQSPQLSQQDLVSAGAIMAILPPTLLFIALNRYYVRGLFAGGQKG